MGVFHRGYVYFTLLTFIGLSGCATAKPVSDGLGFVDASATPATASYVRYSQPLEAAPVRFGTADREMAVYSPPALPKEPSEMIVTCGQDHECFVEAAQLCRGRHLSVVSAGRTFDGARIHFRCSN